MLLLDLGVFSKKTHEVSNKEAIIWSSVWIGLAMLFSGYIYYMDGIERFSQFQSAYWIEKALSVDNLFVFILVFGFFNVEKKNQHRILFYGVVGALILRGIFIFTGVKLIELTYLPEYELFGYKLKINILLTLFGGFLVYAGIKSAFMDEDDDEKDFSKSPGAKFVRWLFPRVTDEFEGDKFFVKKEMPIYGEMKDLGNRIVQNQVGTKLITYATPLLVVVGVIEFTDLLFAVDSIPAIFAIAPNDPFILYSSNIFAILGLRSLYFLLANFIGMFKYLKYGLAVILTFIGAKMIIAPVYHIESTTSLIIVTSTLLISTLISIIDLKYFTVVLISISIISCSGSPDRLNNYEVTYNNGTKDTLLNCKITRLSDGDLSVRNELNTTIITSNVKTYKIIK
jgi:tellurite resistance protein TerC